MKRAAHIDALTAFKINEMHPFYGGAEDIAHQSLAQAHALAVMLGSAFRDSEETASTNSSIIDNAFGGIASLIALAQFSLHGGY